MLKRRDFLKTSAVVATAASAGVLSTESVAGMTSSRQAGAIHFVIVDEELEDSVAFARELVARGACSFSTQQDIGRLWFGDLGAAFLTGHVIAGLTSHTELLVSSEFARLRGARVRFEGLHDCRGTDVLTHKLRGDASSLQLKSALESADVGWPRILAAHLTTAPMQAGALCDASCRTSVRRSPTHPGSLFSWVIV